ncbi:tryptophan-rich sensory protein [Neorhizobium galegae]|uniref:TspO/MBR family protein n=1 Tax=Neorhizobium galegae TaxID=399 RepID=UPI000621383B|nr:TspO/MBR family protein [Neorhizobium galegae]MCQ1767372.1 tryptophan-rich sensory protein [Neorhizobium galegae]MCQ1846684.1 tryptophan-rich sensory protein [Neorhizobium galegae]CDZ35173.1 Tryptophan-rich sensory protein [Neorhizobium galegae bv. officinalis]
MSKTVVMIVFIVACVALGALSGASNVPGEWYQSLDKSFFNPPGWIFAPVWTVLYVLIGVALSETWYDENNGRRLVLFAIQAALNLLWSPAFFGLQSPVLGLVVIVPLLVSILLFIAASWRENRRPAWLFVPYALWVAFATLLNLSIVILN